MLQRAMDSMTDALCKKLLHCMHRSKNYWYHTVGCWHIPGMLCSVWLLEEHHQRSCPAHCEISRL